jgi:hypothetical protein
MSWTSKRRLLQYASDVELKLLSDRVKKEPELPSSHVGAKLLVIAPAQSELPHVSWLYFRGVVGSYICDLNDNDIRAGKGLALVARRAGYFNPLQSHPFISHIHGVRSMRLNYDACDVYRDDRAYEVIRSVAGERADELIFRMTKRVPSSLETFEVPMAPSFPSRLVVRTDCDQLVEPAAL